MNNVSPITSQETGSLLFLPQKLREVQCLVQGHTALHRWVWHLDSWTPEPPTSSPEIEPEAQQGLKALSSALGDHVEPWASVSLL